MTKNKTSIEKKRSKWQAREFSRKCVQWTKEATALHTKAKLRLLCRGQAQNASSRIQILLLENKHRVAYGGDMGAGVNWPPVI